MRIVLEQISTGPSVEENKKRIVDALAHGASLGADLVLLPEACVQPFGLDRKAHTESLDGPFAKSVRKLASELDIVAVLGLATRASDTKRYNTLLVSGRSVHEGYRKIHLFDTPFVRESQGTEAGDTACLLFRREYTSSLPDSIEKPPKKESLVSSSRHSSMLLLSPVSFSLSPSP